MSKSKARVSRPKPDEPYDPPELAHDYPDLLAKLPPKKPPAPSVRQHRITQARSRSIYRG